MQQNSPQIILVAPNVGEQMGGEAIKALQIFQALKNLDPTVIQITHERCRAEIERLGLKDVHFILDTKLSRFIWRSVIFRNLLDYWFTRKAVALAESIAGSRKAIIHQTEPNSPVTLRAFSGRHFNVLGPINGNIYYPEAFRKYESRSARLRRILHMPLQSINRIFFRGIVDADLIFSAGGERTETSLFKRGCEPEQIMRTLDCGIRSSLVQRARVEHAGQNFKFVHFGRLVFHKGTALIIRSLAKTKGNVTLDIVGRGPELDHCKQLASSLGLGERVRFLDWYESHSDLLDSLYQYRGLVLPSIEDANGIVVQEAMAMGLPPVCLDWGGPQLLIETGISGYLVEPRDEEYITTQIAAVLDVLATDGAKAESIWIAARDTARDWVWDKVIREWANAYPGRMRSTDPHPAVSERLPSRT